MVSSSKLKFRWFHPNQAGINDPAMAYIAIDKPRLWILSRSATYTQAMPSWSTASMHLSHLRAIIAVADHHSFGEAALTLNLSQPAISHAIASLENELGISLFKRGRHGAVLTPAGESIVLQARLALQHIDQMVNEANLHRGLKGGKVRIATFRSVATHLLPESILKFKARFPEITLKLLEQPHYVAIEQCLRSGQADIGFTYLPTEPDFDTFEVLRDEYIALFPPQSQLDCQSITWSHLINHPLVFLPCLPCGGQLNSHLRQHAPDLQGNESIQEDSTVISLVYRGLGAAILPRLAAEPIPPEVQWFSLPVPHERIIAAARLRDTLHPPAVFAFWEFLKSQVPFIPYMPTMGAYPPDNPNQTANHNEFLVET
jgi:DNA-binding transcriptional LysR family regulator